MNEKCFQKWTYTPVMVYVKPPKYTYLLYKKQIYKRKLCTVYITRPASPTAGGVKNPSSISGSQKEIVFIELCSKDAQNLGLATQILLASVDTQKEYFISGGKNGGTTVSACQCKIKTVIFPS